MSILKKPLAVLASVLSSFLIGSTFNPINAGISNITVTPSSYKFEDTVITTDGSNISNNISIFIVKKPKSTVNSNVPNYVYIDIYDPNSTDGFYDPYASGRVVQFNSNDDNAWSIGLGFMPNKSGDQTGTIYVRVATDSEMNNIIEQIPFRLTGKGLPNNPSLKYSPNALYFGKLEVGKSVTKEIKIENTTPKFYFLSFKCTSKHDSYTAVLEGKTFDACSTNSDLSVNAGESKTLFIKFKPKDSKLYYEEIVFSSNDTNHPTFKIKVEGEGIDESQKLDPVVVTEQPNIPPVNDNPGDSIYDNIPAIGGIPPVGNVQPEGQKNIKTKDSNKKTKSTSESKQGKSSNTQETIIEENDIKSEATNKDSITKQNPESKILDPNTEQGTSKDVGVKQQPQTDKTKGYIAIVLLLGMVSAGPIVSKKIIG